MTIRDDNDLLRQVDDWCNEHESKPRGELLAAIVFILMLVGAFYVLHVGA